MPIEAIERLARKATSGRWELSTTPFHTCIRSHSEYIVGSAGMASYGQDTVNAALIVAAVNALPALLRIVDAADRAAEQFELLADQIGCNAGHWDGGSAATCEHCQLRASARVIREAIASLECETTP